MSKPLDDALEAAHNVPAPVVLSVDERAAIATSKASAARGEFATDEQVRAIWAKYGL
jgi:formiminotetrahydrofolate cyclodeaminase